ncbi:MAG: hypothetical protein IJJ83_08045 [Muribaculaceae bacterium]|nr:hypothetical protein [Muribaculaceae bacterium]
MNSSEIIYTCWEMIDGLFYPKSFNGDILFTKGFQNVEEFCEGIANVSDGEKWGCIDCSGNIFIPIKYDNIRIEEYEYAHFHIVCGYNGESFTGCSSTSHFGNEEKIYTGIYDLYDFDGDFLIGGFDEYRYDSSTKTFHFLFGRKWMLYPTKYKYSSNEFRVEDRNAKWLILTEDFRFPFDFHYQTSNQFLSAKESIKGSRFQYKIVLLKSLSGEYFPSSTFTTEKWVDTQRSKRVLFIDLPGEVLFDSITIENNNIILCSNKRQYCLLYLKERIKSDYYEFIQPIDDTYAFVYDGYIGIIKKAKLVIGCHYSYITKPVNDCVFAIRRYPFFPMNDDLKGKFYVMFLNLKKRNNCILDYELRNEVIAIEKIDKENLRALLSKGVFRLYSVNEESTSSYPVTIQKGFFHFFSEQFNKVIHKPGQLKKIDKKIGSYWTSSDCMRDLKEGPKSYSDYSEHYSIWDALENDPEAYWNID